MELRQYLNLFRRWMWLLLLGLVLGGVGAYAASLYQTPVYQTSTKVMVMRPPEERSSEYAALNDFQLARTYSQIIVNQPILESVGQRLGYPVSAKQISVRQQTDSLIIALTVEDQDAQRAAEIANGLVGVFIEYNDSLQTNRFASSEQSLKAQIEQVEEQIAGLQTELSQLSQESLETQREQIEEQITKLDAEMAPLRSEISQLESALEPGPGPVLADKRAQLSKLQSTYNLYQQLYFNLTVLGESAGSSNQTLRLNQLQTTLALYQQIYSNLLNNYENVRLARLRSTPNVVQIEPALVPTVPIRPQPLRNSALGAATGLLIMGAIAFLIEYLDDSLKSPDDITQGLGLPLLGIIARHGAEEGSPVVASEPRSPVAEAFRSLRTNIQFSSVDRPLHTLLVTSPSPSDGKSTVAANLAVALAQNDRRVVLLDADLRRPRIHKLFGLPNRDGVSGLFLQLQVYLDGKIHLERSLHKTEIPNLSVLPTGTLPPNPAELLGSEKMADILHQIQEQVDLVVIDTPPVLAVTDATVLAPRVDGVLLVVKPGVTKLAAARQAVEQLRRVGANLLGVVLNDVELKRSSYAYHYGDYYYAYYRAYTHENGSGKSNGKPNGKSNGKLTGQSNEKPLKEPPPASKEE